MQTNNKMKIANFIWENGVLKHFQVMEVLSAAT